jgi:hypothetical protein
MKLLPVIVIMTLCACVERTGNAPGQPFARPAEQLGRIIRNQAYESRLGIDGVAFLDSVVYVSTNVGLLEARGGRITQLDQWYGQDNMVSGPWRDQSHPRVWLYRERDGAFVVHDQAGWRLVARPHPPNGFRSRGDILRGYRFANDSADLWLVSAGHVWIWTDSATWVLQQSPPAVPDEFDETIGFARVDGRELQIVTSGSCAYLPCVNRGFWREAGQWRAPVRIGVNGVEDVIMASNAVYVRGDSGEVVRVGRDSAVTIASPGRCEAIGRTSDGKLIASFRKAGIFVLESAKWRKLFDDPAPEVDGEQWAFIAEQGGVVAYATTTVPVVKPSDPGKPIEFINSGAVGLWVSDGTRLVRVDLPKS